MPPADNWLDSYSIYISMTIPELKELLKSRDLPVSGKKKDLVQYLIWMDYPDLFQVGGLVYDKIPSIVQVTGYMANGYPKKSFIFFMLLSIAKRYK